MHYIRRCTVKRNFSMQEYVIWKWHKSAQEAEKMCPNKQNNMFWQVCQLNFFQKMYIPKLYRGRGSGTLSYSLLLHVFPKGNRNLSFGTTLYSIEQFCRYKSLSYLFMRTYLQEYIKSKWSCLSRILICRSKLNS